VPHIPYNSPHRCPLVSRKQIPNPTSLRSVGHIALGTDPTAVDAESYFLLLSHDRTGPFGCRLENLYDDCADAIVEEVKSKHDWLRTIRHHLSTMGLDECRKHVFQSHGCRLNTKEMYGLV
jgi:hypothetical protein